MATKYPFPEFLETSNKGFYTIEWRFLGGETCLYLICVSVAVVEILFRNTSPSSQSWDCRYFFILFFPVFSGRPSLTTWVCDVYRGCHARHPITSSSHQPWNAFLFESLTLPLSVPASAILQVTGPDRYISWPIICKRSTCSKMRGRSRPVNSRQANADVSPILHGRPSRESVILDAVKGWHFGVVEHRQ